MKYLAVPTITLLLTLFATPSAVVAQDAAQKADTPKIPAGINDGFKDPEMDVEQYLSRFEVESREVYFARTKVLQACGIQPGEVIADVGAGTGFYSRLFARRTGLEGWVYSIDISTRFLQHIAAQATEAGQENITTVLGTDVSIRMPPESVDMVFICDTYHHFESPYASLASIYRALKPGGRLILIDFDRVPGESSDFIMGHVRAGKEVFKSEVLKSGFEFVDEVEIEEFKENYMLRFRKPTE